MLTMTADRLDSELRTVVATDVPRHADGRAHHSPAVALTYVNGTSLPHSDTCLHGCPAAPIDSPI